MTMLLDKSFSDLDKFPVCEEPNCLDRLELQNRFKCEKCSKVFCCDHRLDWKHKCPSTQVQKECTLPTKPVILLKCSESGCGCKLTGSNKFFCTGCSTNYCMAHRLDFVHKCKK
jgi:hypothetical protein